ncbi:hypothetical protein ACKFKG_10595 [Phormidesmis sp. 146-35]
MKSSSSKQDSIEHTTQQLTGVPTGNTIRYHLDKLNDMEALEAQLNQALQSRVPSRIRGGKQRLAIDLHLDSVLWHPHRDRVALYLPFSRQIGHDFFLCLCHRLCDCSK